MPIRSTPSSYRATASSSSARSFCSGARSVVAQPRAGLFRKRRKEDFQERTGARLGLMSFFAKAAIGALKAFPKVNAELQETELVLKKYYDIGVAVSTDEGLVVPVVRDADRKSFAEIEGGIAELATKARDGKLTLEDISGGTFTITNGGIFGSLLSTRS